MLCSICVRGGSKGVKNKNIRLINGKPLIAYTIEQAKKSGLFEHVVISTDSDEIADVAKKYGGEVFFKRAAELSHDKAAKIPVIRDALLRSEEYYGNKFDYVVDLDATSPLREVDDILKAFELFKTKGYDNLFSVTPSHRSPYFNMIEVVDGKVKLVKPSSFIRRQDVPETYDMNASIYIWKRDVLLNNDTLFLENTGIYVMPKERSFDIDDEIDFKIVEFLLKEKDVEK